MDALVKILLFSFNFGLVSSGELCYHTSYGFTYCYGYCSGFWQSEYCNYNYISYYAAVGPLSIGTLVGIIIGSIIGLVIIAAIIVAICATCCIKTAGTRGRVIHPMNPQGGLAVVHSSTNETRFYNAMPSAPPYPYPPVAYGASYPQQLSAVPPPPPSYTANDHERGQPPPSYSSLSSIPQQRNPMDNQPPPPPVVN